MSKYPENFHLCLFCIKKSNKSLSLQFSAIKLLQKKRVNKRATLETMLKRGVGCIIRFMINNKNNIITSYMQVENSTIF